MSKIRIGVIFGGRSGEHEVSLVSASSVIQNLDKKKYEVIPIGITKQGSWISSPTILDELKEGSGISKLPYFLSTDPSNQGLIPLKQTSEVQSIDVFFPVLHGSYGEDGKIQGLFEMAGIPYVGAGVLGSALGMDKVIQKQLYGQVHLPITPYYFFTRKKWEEDKHPILDDIEIRLKFPMFVKPANMGSSVGISKAKNKDQLLQAIHEAAKYDSKILIEQGVLNAREIEFSVLGNDDPICSEPGEIKPSGEFYDYNSKYVDGRSELFIPAPLEHELKEKMKRDALAAYGVLNVKGMARVDFLLENQSERYVISEINTIPGFTSISMYPKLWEHSGISYQDLLDRLITLAIEEHKDKERNKLSFETQNWYNT